MSHNITLQLNISYPLSNQHIYKYVLNYQSTNFSCRDQNYRLIESLTQINLKHLIVIIFQAKFSELVSLESCAQWNIDALIQARCHALKVNNSFIYRFDICELVKWIWFAWGSKSLGDWFFLVFLSILCILIPFDIYYLLLKIVRYMYAVLHL